MSQNNATTQRYKSGYYHYCSYWNTWSLVLSSNPEVVELTLTPVGHDWIKSSKDRQQSVGKINRHFSSLDPRDKITAELPQEVLDYLKVSGNQELIDKQICIRREIRPDLATKF